MSFGDAVAKLSQTTRGKVVLAAIGIYAIIVIGDGLARLTSAGPYKGNYAGEVVGKNQSTLGWAVYVVSGRPLFKPTDKTTRKVSIGPWRVVVRQSGGKTIEVAVPKKIWQQAAPGMKLRSRLDPAFANFYDE